MLPLLNAARPDPGEAHPSDVELRDLMSALMRPSAEELPPALRARLAADEEFCGRLIAAELGALAYLRVQAHRGTLAPAARARLEDASTGTRERNAALVSELQRISARFAAGPIPFMVVKGPTLAQLTAGLNVRPFHDLDLLVHGGDFHASADALRSLGFTDIHSMPLHDYHRIFARRDAGAVTVVELHFGLGDGERGIVPDVAGIWERSTVTSLGGCEVRAPDTTDHLLLAVMQLPHHGWTLRLLADIGLLVSRWPEQIRWQELPERARAWGMWALTASTLYVLDVIFGVPMPERVRSQVRPPSYFRRAQWRLVMDTVAARLGSATGTRAMQLAPLLVLDRAADIVALMRRRAASRPGPAVPPRPGTRAPRRMLDSAGTLPALGAVLLQSIIPARGPRQGRRQGNVVDG